MYSLRSLALILCSFLGAACTSPAGQSVRELDSEVRAACEARPAPEPSASECAAGLPPIPEDIEATSWAAAMRAVGTEASLEDGQEIALHYNEDCEPVVALELDRISGYFDCHGVGITIRYADGREFGYGQLYQMTDSFEGYYGGPAWIQHPTLVEGPGEVEITLSVWDGDELATQSFDVVLVE